jgi:hypothetical protein
MKEEEEMGEREKGRFSYHKLNVTDRFADGFN